MNLSRPAVRIALVGAVIAAIAAISAAPGGRAREGDASELPVSSSLVAGRFLIGYDLGYPEVNARAMAERYGLVPDLWIDQIAVLAVETEGDALPPGVEEALVSEPGVRYVEPDQLAYALDEPNDPNYSLQWAPPLMGAEEAWDMTTGDPDVVVAVLDTGIDLQHADLSGKFTSYGHDFVNGDSNPDDDHGHGTHVGGIVGANTDNGVGVASVGRETKLMAIKVLNASGSGSHSWIAAGITAAADNGAHIINMSLGGPSGSSALLNAVNYAFNEGLLVVAASGNNGSSNPFYPAAYANVVAVGATNQSDQRASFSNYGSWLDMTGPGVSIYSSWCCTGSGGGTPAPYVYASGTSMASPNVAAVAALILAVDPSLTQGEVWAILEDSAVDLGTPGPDIYFGHGRVDAESAVETAVAGGPTATPSPSPTPSPTPTPSIIVLNPVADSFVSENAPDGNYGSLPRLIAGSGPTSNAYIRFDAGAVNGTVLSATLRLFAITSSTPGYTSHAVADNTWGETSITYNNAPPMGAAGGSSGPVSGGTWTSADVTGIVSGGGLTSIGLKSTDTNHLSMLSREFSGSPPELIVTFIGGGPTATPASSATPTVAPSATPIPSATPLPTATPSATPLPTATPSATPLPTASPTASPLPSATPSSTWTPSPVPTATPTATATNTATATATNTASATATNTPIPTATHTASATATNTPTSTATSTATPSGPTATTAPTATPTATPATFTFTTEADAYVLAVSPDSNFGTEIRLRTDGQPVERSYVRFNVQGLPGGASSATLKLFALTGSSAGFSTHVASSNGWGEPTITFNNGPGFGSSIASSGAYGGGAWVSIDVTSAIGGNGLVTFVLNGNDANLSALAARELSGLAAELVVLSP